MLLLAAKEEERKSQPDPTPAPTSTPASTPAQSPAPHMQQMQPLGDPFFRPISTVEPQLPMMMGGAPEWGFPRGPSPLPLPLPPLYMEQERAVLDELNLFFRRAGRRDPEALSAPPRLNSPQGFAPPHSHAASGSAPPPGVPPSPSPTGQQLPAQAPPTSSAFQSPRSLSPLGPGV